MVERRRLEPYRLWRPGCRPSVLCDSELERPAHQGELDIFQVWGDQLLHRHWCGHLQDWDLHHGHNGHGQLLPRHDRLKLGAVLRARYGLHPPGGGLHVRGGKLDGGGYAYHWHRHRRRLEHDWRGKLLHGSSLGKYRDIHRPQYPGYWSLWCIHLSHNIVCSDRRAYFGCFKCVPDSLHCGEQRACHGHDRHYYGGHWKYGGKWEMGCHQRQRHAVFAQPFGRERHLRCQ